LQSRKRKKETEVAKRQEEELYGNPSPNGIRVAKYKNETTWTVFFGSR
jgi:hypothetical protein